MKFLKRLVYRNWQKISPEARRGKSSPMKFLKRLVYRNWQKVHGVRRLELAVLTRYLELSGRRRVLDVGSGKGAFCGELARAGHEVVGVDPSAAASRIAKSFVDPSGDFVLGSG